MFFSFLLLVLLTESSSNACNTTMDCSLNGDCLNKTCHCDPAWTGTFCDNLDILPSYEHSGYHNQSAGASWGGLPIYADGKWHLFVAQMINNCSLQYWGSNSEIIRAESTLPGGPYSYAQTVIPAFAHNPTIRITSDGTYVLFMIGSGHGGEPANCTTSYEQNKTHNRKTSESGIYISYSTSVYGPWNIIPLIFTNPNTSDIFDCSWTNPSPVIFPNNTVYMAFTAGYCHQQLEAVGIATSSHWKGPYYIQTLNAILPKPHICLSNQQYEDPYLWHDSRGFHLLLHGMCPTGVINAKYAYSKDAIDWTLAENDPYTYIIKYSNGSERFFVRCERPQLLFNNDGKPIYLFNGVQPIFGHSFTIARPLV